MASHAIGIWAILLMLASPSHHPSCCIAWWNCSRRVGAVVLLCGSGARSVSRGRLSGRTFAVVRTSWCCWLGCGRIKRIRMKRRPSGVFSEAGMEDNCRSQKCFLKAFHVGEVVTSYNVRYYITLYATVLGATAMIICLIHPLSRDLLKPS